MMISRNHCRGLSLVETLIGIALGLILLTALIGTYLSTKQSYIIQDSLARLQENARLAMRLITHDVRMAGYRGDVISSWSIGESTALPLGTVGGECHTGWVRNLTLPADDSIAPSLTGTNNTLGAFSGCISSSDYLADSDILSVHYADANTTADSAIEAGKVYLRGGLSGGLIFLATVAKGLPSDLTGTGTMHNYRVMAAAYYLRPWSVTAPSKTNPAGDGIPTLMRAILSDCGTTTCVQSEALVEGIANLQVQFGIDKGDGHGVQEYLNADQLGDFTQAMGKLSWRQVSSVRIGLLARSLGSDPGYQVPGAPYRLGDQTIAVSKGYRYLWLTGITARRNQGS